MENNDTRIYSNDVTIQRDDGRLSEQVDQIAVEEPLEIIVGFQKNAQTEQLSLGVTMRTPGDDEDLVTGFLYTEGIIDSFNDIGSIHHTGSGIDNAGLKNRIVVALKSTRQLDLKRFQRHFLTSSSCGVCGKSAVQALALMRTPVPGKKHPPVCSDTIYSLPRKLRANQVQFNHTGGVHAVGLFDCKGTLLVIREDIGRHNAMDKVIGHMIKQGMYSPQDALVCVSSRASFELVQKALMANITFFSAVGAPSSLAVDLAVEYGVTLVGFLKNKSYNTYNGQSRIRNTPTTVS